MGDNATRLSHCHFANYFGLQLELHKALITLAEYKTSLHPTRVCPFTCDFSNLISMCSSTPKTFQSTRIAGNMRRHESYASCAAETALSSCSGDASGLRQTRRRLPD
jgi:hypothetical protein